MLIDLVGDDSDLRVTADHIYESLKFLMRIHAAGGVGGRAEDHEPCAGGYCRFELCGSDLEILFDSCGHEHVGAFGQFDHLHVADPCRSGYDHFVARIDEC